MLEHNFDGIREFVVSATLQSFTAAALQLGVTSSAVGKSVSRLEARLGIKLLHRTTRRINLTNDGELYLESCMRIIDELSLTENFLTTGLEEPRGRVRIDLPATFGRRHILPLLTSMAERYEKLNLAVTFSERTVDMINEGIDLAVRIGELRDDADLVAKKLGYQSLVICASPTYIEKKGVPMSLADLDKHDCIIGWRRGQRASWLLKGSDGKLDYHDVNVRHELGDGECMVRAALSGGGLSQLPTWLISEHLASGELVTLLDNVSGATMPIHAIWPRTRYIQPKVRIIIDELMLLADKEPHIFSDTTNRTD